MKEDLKPCPFCGAVAELRHAMGEFWGHCKPCEASGGSASNRDAAIEAWNRRAILSQEGGQPEGWRPKFIEALAVQIYEDVTGLFDETTPVLEDEVAQLVAKAVEHIAAHYLPAPPSPAKGTD